MEIFAFSGLINAISAFSFGIFVISKNWRERINQLFFLMTIAVAIWGFGYWRWLSSNTEVSAIFWIRILSIGSIFIPILYFHWTTLLIGISDQRRYLIRSIYIVALLFLSFSFSHFFIQGVEQKLIFPFWPIPGVLYNFYLAFFYLGLVLYSLFLLVRIYETELSYQRRGQLLYVILGAFLGFAGGATNFFLWYNIPVLPYGTFLGFAFPFLLGYATLKHHLFNVKVISTELLTFAIWIFLLIQTLRAQSFQDILINGGLFLLVIFFGFFLIRSVIREVKNREQIETLNEQLQASVEELQKLDQLKSEFVNLASHQLRTPLTPIKGFSDMLRKGDVGSLTPEQHELTDKIFFASERMVELIDDFLNVSRLERQQGFTYHFIIDNPDKVVRKIVEDLQSQARIKNLTLTLASHLPSQVKIRFDALKFTEAIENVVQNAIKYTLQGNVWVTISEDIKDVSISIKDTGVGIDKDDIPKIFQKFFRGKEVSRLTTEGTGLGLYFTRRVIEDHGGHIWVQSEGLEKGTEFIIKLPKVIDQAVAMKNGALSSATESPDNPAKSPLLVK